MFSERMEALIKATLADGVLTDQEKKALVNRAEKEGVDLNELEIYIQSILQERQQELEKKSREARAQQEEADLESEKLRSKTLRECPKCGTRIPHLANACPNCGYIIDKTELDEKLTILKSSIDRLTYQLASYLEGGELYYMPLGKMYFKIPISIYELAPQYYGSMSRSDTDRENGTCTVQINKEAVLADASLYKNNEGIREALNNLRIKELNTFLQSYNEYLSDAKKAITIGSKKYGNVSFYEEKIAMAKKRYRTITTRYSDLLTDEIDELPKVEKRFDELQSSSDFQQAALKANKGCLGFMGVVALLVISSSALCFAFL